MTIWAYGEDAHTLWLVGQELERLLVTLGDDAVAADAEIFYRPSFGRRASSRGDVEAPRLRSAFGEFDAIVGTKNGTYLIETKWSSSSEARGHLVRLTPEQVRRHAIMRIYLEEWRATEPADWADFTRRSAIAERLAARLVSVPRPRDRCAHSLRLVLNMLQPCGPVRDVVVFVRVEEDMAHSRFGLHPTEVSETNFCMVYVDARTHAGGRGFKLLPRFERSGSPPEMRLIYSGAAYGGP